MQRQELATQNNALIAFAAAPNQEASDGAGENSPYALALIEALQKKGKTLEQIFKHVRKEVATLTLGKQTPWYNASLIDDIYLNGYPTASIMEQSLSKENIDITDEEIIFWKKIKSLNQKAYYLAYLEKYGDTGRFSDTAKIEIETLQSLANKNEKSKGYSDSEIDAIDRFNSM